MGAYPGTVYEPDLRLGCANSKGLGDKALNQA